MEKTLILGECKWDRHPIDSDVLERLVKRTGEIVPTEGHWQVLYLGFARSGWTTAACQYAAQVTVTKQGSGNWWVTGMQLLDLGQVDEDLIR